ncbi:MAG: sulfurtransferase [Armatimonadetes bacterium]|nr:sulfurtransferase [Armatimonadota bacterium]
MAQGYAHPEVLVDTAWLAEHLKDPHVRIVESSEDPTLYDTGHIPNAINLHWRQDLQDAVRRDWITKEEFERALGAKGIGDKHTVVFYGDKNNWFATYAFWLFKYYGHQDARILNGGRAKWTAEQRPMTKDMPPFPAAPYRARDPDRSIRAFRDETLQKLSGSGVALVDVRSPEEFRGELLAPPAYPQEGAQRGGHIPRAQNIPWGQNVQQDGTFKTVEDLKALYEPKGVSGDKEVIAYCRIGERSSLTWFALRYLLGYQRVKNYDGSWTEWGSLVGVPIEK